MLTRSLALVAGATLAMYVVADIPDLRTQLETLATAEGFEIRGIDRLVPESTIPPKHGSLADRLKILLKNYNYYVTNGTGERIRKVVITSHLTPRPVLPPYQHVPMTRIGSHHQVEGELIGPNNVAVPLSLIVDTGASAIVLPLSMASELGFDAAKLAEGSANTAGGEVNMKAGFLNNVKVGNLTAANVQVNFIEDDKLGGIRLLGMSFLDRFKLTIDDARHELVLLSK